MMTKMMEVLLVPVGSEKKFDKYDYQERQYSTQRYWPPQMPVQKNRINEVC